MNKQSPLANRHEIRILLLENLRIDEAAFQTLNQETMMELADLYHTVNHRLLITMIKEMNWATQSFRAVR